LRPWRRAKIFRKTLGARHCRSAGAPKTAPPALRKRAAIEMWWLTASLAACLILVVGVPTAPGATTIAASGLGRGARWVEALRMTSQKLNLATSGQESIDFAGAMKKIGRVDGKSRISP